MGFLSFWLFISLKMPFLFLKKDKGAGLKTFWFILF